MSAFDIFAKDAARDMLTQVGQSVTYRGSNGSIPTVAVIDRDTELFGGEVQAGDQRWTCTFLVEDVADAQRGDEVVDEDSVVWTLQDRQPNGDKWIDEWSVTKR